MERLRAWWIPGPAPDACAILYLHGNGWNMGDSAYDTARLRRMGFAEFIGKGSGCAPP